jgi:hypothetical protein
MNDLRLIGQLQQYADQASQKAHEYSGVLASARAYIVEHFGSNGLIAAYIVLAVILLVVITKLAKLTFSALKYLVIPSVGLAFIASLVLPYSFATALPVTVTVCSMFLLFKG